jgi:superfamily I DNA/RNA helicase
VIVGPRTAHGGRARCVEQRQRWWRSLQSTDEEALAEERRLFYVAATRAKDRLALTWCRQRGGRPAEGP